MHKLFLHQAIYIKTKKMQYLNIKLPKQNEMCERRKLNALWIKLLKK